MLDRINGKGMNVSCIIYSFSNFLIIFYFLLTYFYFIYFLLYSFALFSLKQYKEALKAYEDALKIDGKFFYL